MTRIALLLVLLIMPLLSSCTSAPAYSGHPAANFDGQRFVNRHPMDKSAGDFVKLAWGAVTDQRSWPDWVDVSPQQVPLARVYSGIAVTFINHATFLIQVDGINILTDPIYSDRASPVQWAGPKRVHAPGISLADLPPIDIVLISHNHYDHLDEQTLLRLSKQQDTPPLILAGLGNGQFFASLGLDHYVDMDWESTKTFKQMEVVFTECRHRSGRGLNDQMKTLWGSFVVKTSVGNIYFAGDTGYGPHLAEAGERHGPFTLALLPIGAYEPRWFMADVHLNPEEAVRAHLDLRSQHSIAMHFGTFRLTYEGIDEPVSELERALLRHNVDSASFDVLQPGLTTTLGVEFDLATVP